MKWMFNSGKKRFWVRKVVVLFLALVILLASAAPVGVVKAAGSWYSSDFGPWYVKVFGGDQNEIFGERYTAAQVQWVYYGLIAHFLNALATIAFGNSDIVLCAFSGNLGKGGCANSLSSDAGGVKLNNNYATGYKDKSLVDLVFADRPLSGIGYVRGIASRFHLIPVAQAQTGPGFGYQALGPIRPLWQGVANVTYVLFVFVILIMAFMIMFRVKISPQTVISVQSALPRIAFGFVLTFFSYAICGFLVDMMYVVIGLISLVLAGVAGGSPRDIFVNMTNPSGGPIGFIIGYVGLTAMAFISVILGGGTDNVAGNIVSGFLLGIVGILILVVVLVVALIVAFGIFWTLLRAFINIFLLTIISPLQFAFGTLVEKLSFGTWLKNFVANLAVFPVTGAFLVLSYMFLSAIIEKYLPSEPFHKAFVAKNILNVSGSSDASWPPLLSMPGIGDQTNWLYFLMSFGLFVLASKVGGIIKSVIEGRQFSYGSAIGETLRPVSTAARGGLSYVVSEEEEAANDAKKKLPVGNVLRTLGIIR